MKQLAKTTEFYLALLIIVLCFFITIINPRFLTTENIFGLLRSFSVVGDHGGGGSSLSCY